MYAKGTDCTSEELTNEPTAYINTISTNFDPNIWQKDQELQLKFGGINKIPLTKDASKT